MDSKPIRDGAGREIIVKLFHLLRFIVFVILSTGLIAVVAQEEDDTCGFDCQNAYQLIDVGVQAYRSGDSASALLYLNDAETALSRDDITPRSALLYSTRGDIYRERELYSRALEDYANSLRRRETAEAFAGRGWIHYALGDYDLAYRDFTSAMRLAPSNGLYHNMRGLVQLNLEQYRRAIDDFGRALRLARGDPATYIFYKNRGDAYTAMGNLTLALDDYERSIAENPYYTKAYLARASIAFRQNRFDDARIDCLRVLQLDPTNIYALLNEGITLFRLGRIPEAMDVFEELVIIQPDFAPAQYWHGLLSFIQGEFETAQASFTQSQRYDSNFADLYFDRGYMYLQQEQYQAAIADFSQYVTYIPGSAASYYYRGQAHYALASYTAALNDYTEAIRLSPGMAEAYLGRSLTYRRLGDIQKADSDLARSETLQPFFRNPIVYNEQSYYVNGRFQGLFLPPEPDFEVDLRTANQLAAAGNDYLAQNRFIPAISAYTDALAINPRSIAVYLGRGNAYLAIDRAQDAINDYTRVLAIEPANTDALRGRGNAYVALGETDLAVDDYRAYEEVTGQLEPDMVPIVNRS